jgi:hypothetical protein
MKQVFEKIIRNDLFAVALYILMVFTSIYVFGFLATLIEGIA